MNKVDLQDAKQAHFSQYGEDGILIRLFEVKSVRQGYFCEFGAWDGRHLSNSFALYQRGWLGCYIEGDDLRFQDLQRSITRDGMANVHAFVTSDGENSLDNILSRHVGDREIDLLSIDIDSDDLRIWKSLKKYRPRVVVIEFNPTIPIDVRYENPQGKNRGNSARSIYEFATSCGYELVAATRCNLIFVHSEFNQGSFETYDLSSPKLKLGTRYFFGYDGTLMVADLETGVVEAPELFVVPWSRTAFAQPLAKPFRRFAEGSTRGTLSSWISILSCTLRRPFAVTRKLVKSR